ncbi:hypothetical protein pb186bvf_021112 [Paramecium bursaria]
MLSKPIVYGTNSILELVYQKNILQDEWKHKKRVKNFQCDLQIDLILLKFVIFKVQMLLLKIEYHKHYVI